jgi:hypothetical protein
MTEVIRVYWQVVRGDVKQRKISASRSGYVLFTEGGLRGDWDSFPVIAGTLTDEIANALNDLQDNGGRS